MVDLKVSRASAMLLVSSVVLWIALYSVRNPPGGFYSDDAVHGGEPVWSHTHPQLYRAFSHWLLQATRFIYVLISMVVLDLLNISNRFYKITLLLVTGSFLCIFKALIILIEIYSEELEIDLSPVTYMFWTGAVVILAVALLDIYGAICDFFTKEQEHF